MAKPKIENVRAEADDSERQCVLWESGARRFHVWIWNGEPNDVIHSNPITPGPDPRRDEHRGLDRTNKTQSAVWAEVWAIVERDNLIAKAIQAHADTIARQRRCSHLKQKMHEIEQDVLKDWRAGMITINAPRFEQYDAARREFETLDRADAS